MIWFMRRTLLGVLVCFVAVGCGDSGPTKPGGSGKKRTTTKKPAGPTFDHTVEKTSKPPELPKPKIDDTNLSPFQRDLLAILRVEMDGDFAKALIMCRKARSKYKKPEEAKALNTLVKRLHEEKQVASELEYAISNLGSPDASVVDAAKKSLRNAGNAGLIMARKVLREATDAKTVDEASLFLLGQNDERSMRLIIHRLRDNPRSPHAILIATELRRALDKMEDADIVAFYKLVKGDKSFRYRGFVQILAEIFRTKCEGNKEKFGATVGDPKAYDVLESYVRKACSSNDVKLQTWSRTFSDIFSLYQPGIRGSYYEGVNFEKLAMERQDSSINVPDRKFPYPDGRQDNISCRWTGFIRIVKPGKYTFYSASDDGQRLWVADKQLVNDWNYHGVVEQSGTIELQPGIYPFKVEFMQGGGGASITVSWAGPGITKQVITDKVLVTQPWKSKK